MWKGALAFIAVLVIGHFAVRYLRSNPLDPVFEGGELVVETNEYEVHFSREGPAGGAYMVEDAVSHDWTNNPQNVLLAVVDFAEARDYMKAYPDFRRYGSRSGLQLANVAQSLAVVGANRLAYNELRRLIDLYEKREAEGGERVCLTLSGEALAVISAYSNDERTDNTSTFRNLDEQHRTMLADSVEITDCAALAEQN